MFLVSPGGMILKNHIWCMIVPLVGPFDVQCRGDSGPGVTQAIAAGIPT